MLNQPVNHDSNVSWIVARMADSVAPGPRAPERRAAAVRLIEAFKPRGEVEEMLAGRCAGFHALFVDDLRIALAGEEDGTRRANRSNIIRMDACFARNLRWLRTYQRERLAGDESETALAGPGAAAAPARDARVQPLAAREPAKAPEEPPVARTAAPDQTESPPPVARGADEPPAIEPAKTPDPDESVIDVEARSLGTQAPVIEVAAGAENALPRPGPAQSKAPAARTEADIAREAALIAATAERRLVVHATKAAPKPNLKQTLASAPIPIGGVAPARSLMDAAVASVKADPRAMAALKAGNPKAFARALGVRKPGKAFIAAARRLGSPFDPLTNFRGEAEIGGNRAGK